MGTQDQNQPVAADEEEDQANDSQSQQVGTEAPKGLPPPDKSKTMYTIAVKTSNIFSAGTDANVFVQLFGQNGNSDSIPLKKSINHRNKFERNHSDVFIFDDLKSLGPINQVKIWHDNSGFGAAWHLEKVAVHDASTNVTYVFPCNKWLSKKDDDRQLCRLLNVETTSKKMPRHFQMQREAESKIATEAAKKSAATQQSPQQAAPYPVYQQGYAPQVQMPQPSAPHETSPQSRTTAPYPTQHSPLYPVAQPGYMPQGQTANAQQPQGVQGIHGQATTPYPSQQTFVPSQRQSYQQSQNGAPQSPAPYPTQQSPYPVGQQPAYAPQGQTQQYATGPYAAQGGYQQSYNPQMPAFQSPFGYPQSPYGTSATSMGGFTNYGPGAGGYNYDPNANAYFGQNVMPGAGMYGGQQQQMYPYGGQQIYGQASTTSGHTSHHKSHKKHHRHH